MSNRNNIYLLNKPTKLLDFKSSYYPSIGPPGLQGIKGEKGDKSNSIHVFIEKYTPDSYIGENNDLFINTNYGLKGDKGDLGDKGLKGDIFENTIISVNPNNISLNTTSDLTGWTILSDVSGLFNAGTGVYTVPSTGLYEIRGVLNYSVLAAITLQLSGDSPQFEIVNASTLAILFSSPFNAIRVNIALLLNLNTILGTAAIPIGGYINLTTAQTIKPRYNSNGFGASVNANLQNTTSTLTIRRIV
ncbi:hypothetical protein CE11_00958 [Megavirus courdo11]|uniref:Collagen-like protein n=1 Tax=Megavirus courdo11 TaxID=1128140 RepID=K7YI09_9VIRU|nr:hypothetical protein CE11_00958 [Megavirus courdo11]